MLAETCLREGKLQAALDALQEEVRGKPADFKLRVFLFQLLVVIGQWERALKQLQVAASLDAEALPMVQAYRELIRCEVLRGEVFQGKREPMVLGEPAPWVALLVQALQHTAKAEHEAAEALRAQALEQAPASAGKADGEPFAWIADADSRLGPVLEVVLRGRYLWVPFAWIRSIQLEPPVDLRDLVWLPAKLHFVRGEASDCFLFSRYVASEQSTDDAVRLSRKTDWNEPSPLTACGLGQRVLVTDQSERGLLELRSVEFTVPEAVAAEAVSEPSPGVEHG